MSGNDSNSTKARTRSTSRTDTKNMSPSDANNGEIMAALKEILSRLDSIEKNVDSINKRMDSIDGKIKSLEHSMQYHSNIVEELKTDVTNLKTTAECVQQLKENNRDHAIMSASKCIEIQGAPYHSAENILDIVAAVGRVTNIVITKDHIDVYKNKQKNIVLKFLQTHIRNAIILKAKQITKTTPLTAKDIGYSSSPNKLYVNEYLLYETRDLFHKVREFQKAANYKFSWCINQKVYVREKENSPAIRIHTVADLKRIKPDY